MAVRFLCPACSQPIEVDDSWAAKTVACPYCRKTITAPSESTLTDLGTIPVASRLGGTFGSAAAATMAPPFSFSPESHPNRIAVVAFALACAGAVLWVAGWLILLPHRLELQEQFRKAMSQSSSLIEGSSKFMEAYHGVLPTWLIAVDLLLISSMAVTIAAIVCAIIGLRRTQRRGLALGALGLCSGLFVFACCGSGLG